MAERIVSSLTAPGSVKNNVNIITVTRLIATHEAKQREVLRRLAEKLQQVTPNSTPFTDIHYIANQLVELLK